MTRRRLVFLFAFLVLGLTLQVGTFSHSAQAQTVPPTETFTPEIDLPGVFAGSQDADDSLLSRYIRAVYIYFIWVVGIIATIMVMYGGIRWVGAAGNPGQIKEARDIIDNAVIGVIIALTSVVLLNIINPKLSNLAIPGLNGIKKQNYTGLNIKKICDVTPAVECGTIQKIGTIQVGGKDVDDYCLGTSCPRANLGLVSMICSLEQLPDGNYRPLAGCTKNITYENGVKTEVDPGIRGAAPSKGVKCGDVSVSKQVGVWCDASSPTAIQNPPKEPACYLLGSSAKFIDKPFGTADIIANACCPGQSCPRS